MKPPELPSPQEPRLLQLILVPALVTLAITLVRLALELKGAPEWLAGREAGGSAAVLGISWLPPLFGILFAYALAHRSSRPYKQLAKALILYGFAARIPVVIITFLALHKGWDTHFNKFDQDPTKVVSTTKAILLTLGSQLIFWPFGWTLGTGMLTGSITLKILRSKGAAARVA